MSDQNNPPSGPNDPNGQDGWGTPPPPPGGDPNQGWGDTGAQGGQTGWGETGAQGGQTGWGDQGQQTGWGGQGSASQPDFGGQPYGGAPPNYGQYGQPGMGGPGQQLKTSGVAVAALVLGILGLLSSWFLLGIPLAVLGVILGIVGIVRAKPENGLKGRGMAIGGLVTGLIGTIIGGLLLFGAFTLFQTDEMQAILQCAEATTEAEMQQCINEAIQDMDLDPAEQEQLLEEFDDQMNGMP